MTRKEAFEALIHTEGASKLLGIKRQSLNNLKLRFKAGTITEDSMAKNLLKAGAKCIQQEAWTLPETPPIKPGVGVDPSY